jgi:hypothetical protein
MCAGYVAGMRATRTAYKILVGESDWKRSGVDVSATLKWILNK